MIKRMRGEESQRVKVIRRLKVDEIEGERMKEGEGE